ncbi:hypothetical protein BBO99_00008820 [Phytophthora kernoviae]|uniref:FYVE-type domain-containing protein n=2 Tax=Phytophthora kernoviae TaxID=325452 RepID=A0A3R7IR54_9STRA|nr:hypothetical protein G195_010380 [Phytophthora kernoviae 00238/432]KAG2509609.1 hypothetical protein JM16_008664 [Phytophthora kernoviae]KAG2511063.1 hypothetical protein JM18_008693 [Phytophthora kernoviae]RLN46400.1 hypothetical protein BBI17_009517 [Phytophthora kernoviae]RLN74651.1 hypothetical protein BBO99_00008820 [Phytophthora kernoviae]
MGSVRPGRSARATSRARAPTYHRKTSSFQSYRPPQEQRRGGLAVRGSRGDKRMLFTDQELADDLLFTIPKLHAAISMDARGSSKWHRKGRKGGVMMYELVPSAHGDNDMDLAYASLAKTELRCHLNEVLNVLISHESGSYQSTMAALCGEKFRDGRVVFQQKCRFSEDSRRTLADLDSVSRQETEGQKVLISVNTATLQPTLRLKLQAKKHRQPQKLCFSSFTHQYVSKNRAVHIMKTLPKHIHDELIPREERTALRRELDHLAVGFDIQSKLAPGGSSNQRTSIIAHGYAAVTPPEAFGAYVPNPRARVAVPTRSQVVRRRAAIINPEAKHVLDLLTRSLREFERVIRRRRFGFQSFVYFHSSSVGDPGLKSCLICQKKFSLLRRDFFCQLCGHMVCRDCSQLYEVEARVGEVRQNRICVECVVRVDACKFEDENLIAALGPVVVSDDRWFTESELDSLDDDMETASLRSDESYPTTVSSNDTLHDQLASDDPATRSQALEQLGRLVSPTSSVSSHTRQKRRHRHKSKTAKEPPKDLAEKVRWDIEHHLKQSLRVAEKVTRPEDCDVADLERDYIFEFDSSRTRDPNHPLPPMPEDNKENKRLQYIQESGVLDPTYDRVALNLLAQVAAKQLNCPVGYVSMVGEETFHAVGTFPPRPPEMNVAPRIENMCAHTVYADKPLVVKNPQRDMRFAQMPIIKDAGVKFYAGFPIRAPDGAIVASLCTSDFKPHDNISTKDLRSLRQGSRMDWFRVKSSAMERESSCYVKEAYEATKTPKTPGNVEAGTSGVLRDGEAPNIFTRQYMGLVVQCVAVGFVSGALPSTVYPVMQAYLNASGAQMTTATTLILLPSSFKVFYGALSDCLPLFGYRRRPYMVIGWTLCVVMLFIIGCTDIGQPYFLNPSDRAISPKDYTPEIETRLNREAPAKTGLYIILMGLASFGGIFTNFSYTAASPIQIFMVGVTPINNTVSDTISTVMIMASFIVTSKYGLEWNWRTMTVLTAVVVIILDAVCVFVTIWDVFRSQWFWLGLPVAVNVPTYISYLIGTFIAVELVGEGQEGAMYGLLTNVANLSRPVATALTNIVDISWDISNERVQADDYSVRRDITETVLLMYGMTAVSWLFVFLLPKQKRETQELKQTGGSSTLFGALTVGYLAIALLWCLLMNIFVMLPSTSCLVAVGGDGC